MQPNPDCTRLLKAIAPQAMDIYELKAKHGRKLAFFGNIDLVVIPMITPVHAEDRVDAPAFRSAIRRLIAAGVDAPFVGGLAGVGPLLADREQERIARNAR